MPDIFSRETDFKRDRFLFAMAKHELLTRSEDRLSDILRLSSAFVDDDAHSRAVVDEVLCESSLRLLDRVATDERLEGIGYDLRIFV